MELNTKILGSVISVSTIGTVVGGWLFLDSYFAKAEELKSTQISTEQAMIEIQLDILEDRLERAKNSGDVEKQKRIMRRYRKLQKRQELLDKIELQMK